MRGQVVADQRQDHHHDVFGHADAVAIGHLGNSDAPVHRRLQVDVIRADAGRDRELQLGRLANPLGSQVGGPERLRDDDVGVCQFLLEHAVGTVLVGRHDKRVTLRLEKLAQPELAGDAPQQLARPEIDRLGCRSGLPAGIALDPWNVIARIGFGIPRHGIFVEHTDDLGHRNPPLVTVNDRLFQLREAARVNRAVGTSTQDA